MRAVINTKQNQKLRVALVSDALTGAALEEEVIALHVTPLNYRWVLKFKKPDILFVESVWKGKNESWKYKVASYADHPKRNNKQLLQIVTYAKDLGIPTVFWNKEDSVHFDRFINSAKIFDYVFTVDENAISRYTGAMGPNASVKTLLFAVQPSFHYFSGFNFKHKRANFIGSYSSHIHEVRRARQKMLFESVSPRLGLTVVDRNSDRKNTDYRYPDLTGLSVSPAVPYAKTAQIYRDHLVSLNVNTIEDSNTMFSRRLIEILGTGGIAVTTPSKSVDYLFKDYCHVVSTPEESHELFDRLKHGPTQTDLERARAGAEYVAQNHTWEHRVSEIREVIGI